MRLMEKFIGFQKSDKKKCFILGGKKSLPLLLGVIPFGFAYGVFAREAGLNILETTLMSVLVFAGTSQFIAVKMISNNTELITIIISTFLINLRHLLMSISLVPYFKRLNRYTLFFFSFGLTDESYALTTTELKRSLINEYFMLGANLIIYLTWITSSFAGAVIGSRIINFKTLGLDFALPATFIGLLALQMETKTSFIVLGTSLVFSLLIYLVIPGKWYIIIASLLAATGGVLWEKWIQK